MKAQKSRYAASVELNEGVRAKDWLNRWYCYTGFNMSASTMDELKIDIKSRLDKINRRGKVTIVKCDGSGTFTLNNPIQTCNI